MVAVPLALVAQHHGQTVEASQPPATTLQMKPLEAIDEVTAKVGLTDVPWGTRVSLECSYKTSLYTTPQEYTLYAVARSGTTATRI